jgi:hypothetical protein
MILRLAGAYALYEFAVFCGMCVVLYWGNIRAM